MKAIELLEELKQGGTHQGSTCDTIKSGSADTEVKRVAVSMFATVDVIKRVKAWGADTLIVHEPTYYDHMDIKEDNPVTKAKEKLICESGITIFRYHDFMHARETDQITEGECYFLGLKGKVEHTEYSASYILEIEEPLTALEMARRMENELGIKHVRIAGTRDKKASKIALSFGTPAGVYELLCREDIDMVLTGEACEWKLGEYARDADLLGINKSLIVMGHIPSERDGMRLLALRLQEKHKELEIQYFECGEVYTYTDSDK
ncbi:MAG: Nif3-like dinuclear metal center hexameric protein [Clostridia bacterium]|nr:Nif3-like dinuclear metal center hexameric protein [Clostridia bacterium]